jgi:hypothetical protein
MQHWEKCCHSKKACSSLKTNPQARHDANKPLPSTSSLSFFLKKNQKNLLHDLFIFAIVYAAAVTLNLPCDTF